MKRLAGIAQAMLNDPKILILDEPAAGLDPNERIRFRNLISELSEECMVLLSTHIVADIEYIANEILLMKEGVIVKKGTLEEMINSLPERVWICIAPQSVVSAIAKKYKVSNMKMNQHEVKLRIISAEKPCENAVPDQISVWYIGNLVRNLNQRLNFPGSTSGLCKKRLMKYIVKAKGEMR